MPALVWKKHVAVRIDPVFAPYLMRSLNVGLEYIASIELFVVRESFFL